MKKLEPMLREKGQEKVFYEIESPLLPVLLDMEFEGVRVEAAALGVGSAARAAGPPARETSRNRLATAARGGRICGRTLLQGDVKERAPYPMDRAPGESIPSTASGAWCKSPASPCKSKCAT